MTNAKSDDSSTQTDTSVVGTTAEYLGVDDAKNFAVEGNDLNGFIGVSPEYMTYADETHKPLSTSEEVVPRVEQLMLELDEDEATVVSAKSTTVKDKSTSTTKSNAGTK